MPEPEETDELTFRPTGRSTAAGVPAAVALAFFVFAAVKPTPVRGLIADLVLGVVLAFVAQRAWVSQIRAADDGVRVTGLVRTRFVPWSELERFEVAPTAVLLAVRVVRVEGRTVSALNLGAQGFQRPLRLAELQEIAGRLNELLAERKPAEQERSGPDPE